ncbi:hypothetical protein [Puia dinghuensis]|uniref:Uncharacterized protein n=1 Tax=Puia dinghuensis TaxID=1792502 RepID=A0A8J2UE66_9BACT|nr:hypothetical protein [Puia dinghuensis]GGB05337.1 hypothetical protein GCM10011511_30850 [Puia dinghuensis]
MKKQFKTNLQSRSTLLALSLAFILTNGCTSNESNAHATAPADSTSKSADEIVPPTNPNGFSGAIGNVVKYADNQVEISAGDKPVFIKLTDSLRIYAPSPSSLANVKSSEYIGVISKKQPDQPDQAVQVLILPEELRGLNEGSFMLPADKGAESPGRMTNGSASDIANSGASRMSNGSVSEADTTSLTLQYQGHARTVNVPPGTPVVEYKVSSKKPSSGDKIFLLVKKDDHDSLTSSKIVCF